MSAIWGARPLIPAARMGALVDSAALLAEARATRDSAEALVREAIDAGRRDGFAAGLEEGRAVFARRIADVVTEAEAKLLALEKPIVGLVVDAVEKIIGEIPQSERIVRLVQRALRDMNVPGPVTLFAPSAAADALRQATTGIERHVTVAADPLLTQEELVLEVLGTRIHIGAPDQVAHLRESLDHG